MMENSRRLVVLYFQVAVTWLAKNTALFMTERNKLGGTRVAGEKGALDGGSFWRGL